MTHLALSFARVIVQIILKNFFTKETLHVKIKFSFTVHGVKRRESRTGL
jgi:hypothetical protein